MQTKPDSRDHRELQFCRLLDELYAEDVTQGDTTKALRASRARALIQREKAADRLVAKGQTMAQAFESVFGEALDHPYQHEHGDGQ